MGLQSTHTSNQLQPRAHGLLCIVLMGLRVTKVDQDPGRLGDSPRLRFYLVTFGLHAIANRRIVQRC